MTFLAPGFLIAAGALAAAVVAIHFIVTHEPRTVQLPTARFAPQRPVRATARRMRLSDLLLLLLRVLLILVVGAGLARPVMDPPRRDITRIVLVDRSRAVADPAEVADSARAYVRAGDAVVLFDSAAVPVIQGAADTLANLATADARGSLSAALIAALRTASNLRQRADSLEMVLVSALSADLVDAATDSVRALWPAALRIVPVTARQGTRTRAPRLRLVGAADDPLRFAFPDSVLVREPDTSAVLIMRGAVSDEPARIRVHWPASHVPDTRESTLPDGWEPLAPPDTIGGLTIGTATVVAAFPRAARYAGTEGHIIARWSDGSPAAVEVTTDDGCYRTAAIPVPETGDLVLQPRFRQIAAALTGPCAHTVNPLPLDSARLRSLAGTDVNRFIAGGALPAPEHTPTPVVPWLFAVALALAAAALLLQRKRTGSPAAMAVGGEA